MVSGGNFTLASAAQHLHSTLDCTQHFFASASIGEPETDKSGAKRIVYATRVSLSDNFTGRGGAEGGRIGGKRMNIELLTSNPRKGFGAGLSGLGASKADRQSPQANTPHPNPLPQGERGESAFAKPLRWTRRALFFRGRKGRKKHVFCETNPNCKR